MDVTGAAAVALVGGTEAALLVTAVAFELGRRRIGRDVAAEHAAIVAAPVAQPDGETAVAGMVEALDDAPVTADRPFLLRLASGRTLRVEPGDAPLGWSGTPPAAGKRLFVRGVLQDGAAAAAPHRGAAWDGVMTAPGGRAMRLSTSGVASAAEGRADDAAMMVWLMLVLLGITGLLYVGFWIDLARGNPLSIIFDLFFWVMLIDGSFILGAVISAWQARPWWRGSS